jgi:dehydrogenase/reductase SDR family member 7B
MNVNCLSPIALIKGFVPKMLKQQGGAQIVNILSVAGQVGVPQRSYYSASKFALDGFGKAIQGELGHRGIRVLQCYPAYVRTNISKNALVGDNKQYGKTDSNIENGISVESAVETLLIAMFLNRSQITLGSPFFWILPRLCACSESITDLVGYFNNKQQQKALDESKSD